MLRLIKVIVLLNFLKSQVEWVLLGVAVDGALIVQWLFRLLIFYAETLSSKIVYK